MKELISKISLKFIVVISVIFMACICTFVLSSCDSLDLSKSASDMQKASTTSYLAQINSISQDFKNIISDFETDVKNKDIDSMKNKLSEADKLIEDFKSIDAPEPCKDVASAYSDGFMKLQQALSKYVQIYSDINSGSATSDTSQQITEIQNLYNQALEQLRQADKLAAEK